MNNTQELLTKIKAEINKANNTLLTAYHRYDGDAVGCEIAMYCALKKGTIGFIHTSAAYIPIKAQTP